MKEMENSNENMKKLSIDRDLSANTENISEDKGLKQKFNSLSKWKKMQVAAASLLTLAIMILPVYAWFAQGGKLEAFTKIKEPDNLDIRAAHYDAIQYFDLSNIDIEEVAEGKHHMVVFSVSAGDYKIPYQIQLAHTTNIPFVYEIYRAKEFTYDKAPAEPDVTYVSLPIKNQAGTTAADYTFYYKKVEKIDLEAKNPDTGSKGYYGRQLAVGSGKYYEDTYNNADDPEIYAVPIYEQSKKITTDSNNDHDYFILEISWDETAAQTGNFKDWNVAENKKETDVIYLTASRFSD